MVLLSQNNFDAFRYLYFIFEQEIFSTRLIFTFKETVPQGGFDFCWHAWADLGKTAAVFNFFNCCTYWKISF